MFTIAARIFNISSVMCSVVSKRMDSHL